MSEAKTIQEIAQKIRDAVQYLGDDLPYTASAAQMRRLADEMVSAHEREMKSKVKIGDAAECQTKPLTLDEAISHAEKCTDETPCGQNHRQLADWLKELRDFKHCDAAKLREAVGNILKYADSAACRDHDEHTRHYIDQIRKWAQYALAAPARNCDRFNSGDVKKDANDALVAMLNEMKSDGNFGYRGTAEYLLSPITPCNAKGGNDGK